MGYKSIYGKDPAPAVRIPGRLRVMTAALMLIFVLAVRYAWPGGTALLRQALEPRGETVSAFSEMVTHINGGGEVGQAVTVFCRKVVSG